MIKKIGFTAQSSIFGPNTEFDGKLTLQVRTFIGDVIVNVEEDNLGSLAMSTVGVKIAAQEAADSCIQSDTFLITLKDKLDDLSIDFKKVVLKNATMQEYEIGKKLFDHDLGTNPHYETYEDEIDFLFCQLTGNDGSEYHLSTEDKVEIITRATGNPPKTKFPKPDGYTN